MLRVYPRGAWIAFAWCLLAWFSVVLLGEHYVIDVLGGVLLATLSWLVMMRVAVPASACSSAMMAAPHARRRWLPDLSDGLSFAEVHAHTRASDGMVTAVELVRAAAAAGLQVVCITDHDVIPDLAEAADVGASLGVDVVRGEEVTCVFPPGTHIVGLFLERQIRMHMSAADTVDAIHEQGGLAIVAHPFMPTYFASMSQRGSTRCWRRTPSTASSCATPRRCSPVPGSASTSTTPPTASSWGRRWAPATAISARATSAGC